MGELFGSIYCWFEDFFGLILANYLWGQESPLQQTNMFIGIGLCALAISLFIVVLFYYVINHPKLNNWWGWTIFLAFNAIVNFIVGWQWVLNDQLDGKMITKDPANGIEVPLDIYDSDIICFGVTNMIVACMFFIVLSLILKWWSKNCSQAPF